MCTCHENVHCECYASAQEYREERARQAAGSIVEHDVLDLLRDAAASASPPARRFVAAIRADPRSLDGAAVTDILATGNGIFWWSPDGAEHHAQFDAVPAIRLVA
ncbi:hypothetical protein [Paraburkholderia youngii]|uniref:hypothetical protein n=1 Tax=Paraburkholderia youngii TaxID=2782701 RepID=UPI003D21EF17